MSRFLNLKDIRLKPTTIQQYGNTPCTLQVALRSYGLITPNLYEQAFIVGGDPKMNTSQGYSVALTSDGNLLAVGDPAYSADIGRVWFFRRIDGEQWVSYISQYKEGTAGSRLGTSVSFSSDGRIFATGLPENFVNSVNIYIQGNNGIFGAPIKITGNDLTGNSRFGMSISLSSDGATLAIGGPEDNSAKGATWIFVRSGFSWIQQGLKLLGTGVEGNFSTQGQSVSLSGDGNTLAIGGPYDNNGIGAVWIFIRSGTTWIQQGKKLVGTGVVGFSQQGFSVSLSANGNTLAVGGYTDNNRTGATWIFIRTGTVWSQQGSKLVGFPTDINNGTGNQGQSVSLSGDGNTLVVGSPTNNALLNSYETGCTFVFKRSNNIWTQYGKRLIGNRYIEAPTPQGSSVAIGQPDNLAGTYIYV